MNRMSSCVRKLMLLSGILLLVFLLSCAANKQFRLGNEESTRENWDAAVLHYSQALEHDPDNVTYKIYLLKAKEKAAIQHYKMGMEYYENKEYKLALTELKVANVLSPSNQKIKVELQNVMNSQRAMKHLSLAKDFMLKRNFQHAATSIAKAMELDNKNEEILATFERIRQAVDKLREQEDIRESGVARLKIDSALPIDLVLYDTPLKKVFETLAKVSRINIFFDEDFEKNMGNKKVDVEFRELPFNKVLNLLLTSNNLFMNAIDERSIIVIPDNARKRRQYKEQVIRVFYLSNAEAKKMKALLQGVLGRGKYVDNEELNTIIVRDEPEKVMLAERIIELNDKSEPEVLLDIELLEVNRNRYAELGMRFSDAKITESIQQSSTSKTGTTTQGISLQALQYLNQTDYIFSLPSVYYNFLKTNSMTKTLANPQVRITNQEKASLELGQEVPIKKTLFNTSGGTTYEQTNYEFKRIGINIQVTPFIHFDQSVSLDLKVNIDNIESYNSDGYPTVGVRKVETFLRLQDGEIDILAGLIREDITNTKTKVPILGDIPYLGNLFTNTEKSKNRTDLIIAITPHIIRLPDVHPEDSQPIYSGTEDNFRFGSKTREWYESVPDVAPEDSEAVPVLPGSEAEETEKEKTREEAGDQQVEVFINPAVRRAGIRNIFTVEVRIKNARDVGSVPFYINYDPTIVQGIEAEEGGFLKRNGASTSFMFFPDEKQKGTVMVGYSRLGQDPGADGGGILAIIKFKALKMGETALTFANHAVKDATGKDIPARFTAGKIIVQ